MARGGVPRAGRHRELDDDHAPEFISKFPAVLIPHGVSVLLSRSVLIQPASFPQTLQKTWESCSQDG